MKRILLAVLALAGLGWAAYSYAPARLALWVALGRSPECPFANAVQADANLKEQIAAKDRILKASKLLETDAGGYRLYQTPDGPYWIPKGSDYVLPFNLAEQERDIYGTGGNGVRKGDVVLDCGANIGVYTRKALNAGASLVVAIEPAPENIECLRRNFRAGIEARRVIVYPKGVWDKDDFLTLNVDPQNSAADSFLIQRQGAQAVEKVPLTTIDKLAAELNLERVDFIKMDIEGAEPNAITGARQTIAKYHPRLALSAYHAPDHPQTLPRMVKEIWPGYRMACGVCAEANHGVRPDVLFFFP